MDEIPYYGGPPEDPELTLAEVFSGMAKAYTVNFALVGRKMHEWLEAAYRNGRLEGYEPIWEYYDEIETVVVDAYEKVKAVHEYIDKASDAVDQREKGRGKVPNHGPRSKRLFDNRGRRRY